MADLPNDLSVQTVTYFLCKLALEGCTGHLTVIPGDVIQVHHDGHSCPVHETGNQDEPRYWVNDSGPNVVTIVTYEDGHQIREDKFVGLMDERAGGMVAYGSFESMTALADELNKTTKP